MNNDLNEKESELCREFALRFARQQGWYDGINSALDIDEHTNDGYGYSVFEQGLNIATISLKFFKPHLSLKPVASCRGVDSAIRDYDAKLGRQQAHLDSADTDKATEIRNERKFIRRLLQELNLAGCLMGTSKCFESEAGNG